MCCAIAGAAITEARIAALPNNASLDMHFSIRLCQGERRMRNTNGGSDLGSKRGSNSCDDWETLFCRRLAGGARSRPLLDAKSIASTCLINIGRANWLANQVRSQLYQEPQGFLGMGWQV